MLDVKILQGILQSIFTRSTFLRRILPTRRGRRDPESGSGAIQDIREAFFRREYCNPDEIGGSLALEFWRGPFNYYALFCREYCKRGVAVDTRNSKLGQSRHSGSTFLERILQCSVSDVKIPRGILQSSMLDVKILRGILQSIFTKSNFLRIILQSRRG